jgi:uncharacterized iron-regulated membrane protein
MTSGRLFTGWLILLLAMSLATGPVLAAPHYSPRMLIAKNNHGNKGSNGGISQDEAVQRARQRYNGKVLSAETIRDNGRKVYRIKILTPDGRVKRIRIDAHSGN